MLHGAGTAAILETVSPLPGREVALQETTVLVLTFKDVGKLFPEDPVLLLVQAGGPLFTLAILAEQGTFIYKSNSHINSPKTEIKL